MKIQIEDKEFILASSANLVRAAYQAAKCADERHQIVKALIERFPLVRDMVMEDLLQFLAMLPSAEDINKLKDRLTESQKELGDTKYELAKAKAACRAVSDARLFMTDGSLSNEIEDAIEAATKIGYAGEVRPYPPALKPGGCTCNHCQQQRVQAVSIGGATFISGSNTEP